MRTVMRHEARQVPSWLIFDVRQKMNLRRASEDEVPAIVKLARESFNAAIARIYGEDGNRTFMEFASVERMLTRMRENYVTYVAERGGELVGMAHVRDGHHLAMLFVRPDVQRSGVGRRLVEFLAAECTCEKLTVASSPNSEDAYRRFGFVRIADEKVDRGIRFIMMERHRNGPNKAPEPTPGTVTPRATEGFSK